MRTKIASPDKNTIVQKRFIYRSVNKYSIDMMVLDFTILHFAFKVLVCSVCMQNLYKRLNQPAFVNCKFCLIRFE